MARCMKRIQVFLCVALGVFSSLTAGAEERSNSLEQLRFRYQLELEKLRSNYVKGLAKLVERQTKAGNIEAAVEARKELERIKRELAAAAKHPPKNDEELSKYMAGSKWWAGTLCLTFRKDGKVDKSWGQRHPSWTVKGMNLHYEGKVFEFDADFRKITHVSGNTKDPKVWILRD